MSKSFFVKALSGAGALAVMLNIAINSSLPTLASNPYAPPNWEQDMNTQFPSLSLVNYDSFGLPNDNAQQSFGAPASPFFAENLFDLSEFQPRSPSPQAEIPINYNVPQTFNNGQISNLPAENNPNYNTPVTIIWLNLPFVPDNNLNLSNGPSFGCYLNLLFRKTNIKLNRTIACRQAIKGLNLARNDKNFLQAIQGYGVTRDEVFNPNLFMPNEKMLASELYNCFAQNYRVWAAIFNALIYLDYF